jgi:hypothetical protein
MLLKIQTIQEQCAHIYPLINNETVELSLEKISTLKYFLIFIETIYNKGK